MKIVINGRSLNKAYTGVAMVTKHLTKEMALAYPNIRFVLILSDKCKVDYSEFFPKNVEIKIIKEWDKFGAGFAKTFFEQVSFVNAVKKEKAEIAFYPYPSNPWRKTSFLVCVIAHDAIPWKYPEYSNGLLSKIYNSFSKRFLKKADIIFAVSKYSKKEISKYAGIPEESIKVVYNDAGDEYKNSIEEEFSSECLKKLKLKNCEYFIYAGGYDERKNVKQLIEEFEEFQKINKKIKLLLIGEKVFNIKMYSSFNYGKDNPGIVFSGAVSEKELCAFYSNAIALVHLSKDEGFNLPIVEASNCACPLILSDIEINREIAGKDAVFVDIENKGEASQKMNLMMDKEFRERAVAVSLRIAGNYLWERSALRYMNIILTKIEDE